MIDDFLSDRSTIKPYLPEKQEFLKYTSSSYHQESDAYQNLKHIVKICCLQSEIDNPDIIDDIVDDAFADIQVGAKMTPFFDWIFACLEGVVEEQSMNVTFAAIQVIDNVRSFHIFGNTLDEIGQSFMDYLKEYQTAQQLGPRYQYIETSKPARKSEIKIIEYAAAASNLYGVISIQDFVELYNHYEKKPITVEYANSVFESIGPLAFYAHEKNIQSYLFDPKDDESYEEVKTIVTNQFGMSRYVPSKKEFLKYVSAEYLEPTLPYQSFKKFLMEHKLLNKKNEFYYDLCIEEIHEAVLVGWSFSDIIDYLRERIVPIDSDEVELELYHLLINIMNNTRLFSSNGHTPNERGKMTFNLDINEIQNDQFANASRNKPCPCGSGKKYKNCHGKLN